MLRVVGLGQSLEVALGFAGYILPIGFLGFRFLCLAERTRHPRRDQLLWAVALGLPLAVLATILGGKLLSPLSLNCCFAFLLILALGLLGLARGRGAFSGITSFGSHRVVLVALLLFALYCLGCTLDLEAGQHVFVSTVLADWSVRVSMVGAALRSGVPPINGLSTLTAAGVGVAPALRYYYFWYVFVAQVARTLDVAAQPALAASCIWAGWSCLASLLLALKYLTGSRSSSRWTPALFLAVLAVHGLDLLPTAWLWLSRSHHPFPEMEWWHQDRTPSFLGAVLYAPHHVAAIGSLLAGFLCLLLPGAADHDQTPPTHWARRLAPIPLAGCAFAAAAGLSLFPTFCFAIVLTVWALDLVRRRDWSRFASLAAAGVLALLLAHGYLRELSAGSSAASGFVSFAWRNDAFVASQFARGSLARYTGLLGFALRQPIVLLLDLFELGFYIFVLTDAVRRDLLEPGRLSRAACAWWALLLGSGLPALFLTSTATSGPNDLGVDAALIVRLALQLRAADWLLRHWPRRNPRTRRPEWLTLTSALLLALGLGAQVYQALSIRFYYPLVGSGRVGKQMDALTQDHLSARLFNIRSALAQFDRAVPPSRPDTEAVQFNPVGSMLPAEVYFNTHQVASWDTGCGTSYGGDYRACAPIYHALLFLYGNTEAGVLRGRAGNDRQDAAAPRVATAADLADICRALKLRAVVAESTDSIWRQPASWVWTAPALVANSTVRVMACPAGSWRP